MQSFSQELVNHCNQDYSPFYSYYGVWHQPIYQYYVEGHCLTKEPTDTMGRWRLDLLHFGKCCFEWKPDLSDTTIGWWSISCRLWNILDNCERFNWVCVLENTSDNIYAGLLDIMESQVEATSIQPHFILDLFEFGIGHGVADSTEITDSCLHLS